MGQSAFPIEIKLAQTFHSDFKKTIEHWFKLEKNQATKGFVIYCGKQVVQTHPTVSGIPWFML